MSSQADAVPQPASQSSAPDLTFSGLTLMPSEEHTDTPIPMPFQHETSDVDALTGQYADDAGVVVSSNCNLPPLQRNESVEDAGSWFLHIHGDPQAVSASPSTDALDGPAAGVAAMRPRKGAHPLSRRLSASSRESSTRTTSGRQSDASLQLVTVAGAAGASGSRRGTPAGSLGSSRNAEPVVVISSGLVSFLEAASWVQLEAQFLKVMLPMSVVPPSVTSEMHRREESSRSGSANIAGSIDLSNSGDSNTSSLKIAELLHSTSFVRQPSTLAPAASSQPVVASAVPSYISAALSAAAGSGTTLGGVGSLGYGALSNNSDTFKGSTISEASSSSGGRAGSRQRRMRRNEQMIARLKHPQMGFGLKDRRRGFQTYKQSFLGADLVAYMLKPPVVAKMSPFISREECLHYVSRLFSVGYLCSYGLYEKFVPDSSLYTFQNSLLWASHDWQPDERDYIVYLYRRQARSAEKYQLDDFEDDRLRSARRAMRKEGGMWTLVEKAARDQAHVLKDLRDSERKLLQLWEYYFWRVHRPPPGADAGQLALVRPYAETADPPRDSFYAPVIVAPGVNLPPPSTPAAASALGIRFRDPVKLLAHLQSQVESFQHQASLNSLKVSQAAKNVILRCEVLKYRDPLLNDDLYNTNPYIIDNPRFWQDDRTRVCIDDVHLWAYTFNDLLASSRGINIFRAFLQVELSQENLDFYLATRALDYATTGYWDFREKAQIVYDEFITDAAERLININSSIRGPIVRAFAASKVAKRPSAESPALPAPADRLPYAVFSAAQSHIFELMSKDSYQRFLQSDFYKEVYASVLYQDRQGSFQNHGLTEQLLSEPEQPPSAFDVSVRPSGDDTEKFALPSDVFLGVGKAPASGSLSSARGQGVPIQQASPSRPGARGI